MADAISLHDGNTRSWILQIYLSEISHLLILADSVPSTDHPPIAYGTHSPIYDIAYAVVPDGFLHFIMPNFECCYYETNIGYS